MEQKQETLKPKDLVKLFIDEFNSLNSEYSEGIAKQKIDKKHQKNMNNCLQGLIAIIAPLDEKTEFSKEEDELLIDVLNSYEKIHGYLLGFDVEGSSDFEIKLAKIYERNIDRWREEFRDTKKIPKHRE